MIPYDFEYYKPETIAKAIQTYRNLVKQDKTVIYYSGGTEFITFSRINKTHADAIIDLKGISDCQALKSKGDMLIIGSGVSLNKIAESNLFPFLGQVLKQVADHTSRNKITIGGNLHSRLIYREGILPLLLSDAQVKIAGEEGEKTLALENVFHHEMKLEPGQFLVQILIKKDFADDKFVCLKKTKISKVGYPVVSIAALVKDKQVRAAFSGVCEYPFRSAQMEAALNDSSLSIEQRIEKAVSLLPSAIVDDIQASQGYREFVLKNAIREAMEALKEAFS